MTHDLISKANFKAEPYKIILITGSGGGIGYETARALVYLGAMVIIAEINQNWEKLLRIRLAKNLAHKELYFNPYRCRERTRHHTAQTYRSSAIL